MKLLYNFYTILYFYVEVHDFQAKKQKCICFSKNKIGKTASVSRHNFFWVATGINRNSSIVNQTSFQYWHSWYWASTLTCSIGSIFVNANPANIACYTDTHWQNWSSWCYWWMNIILKRHPIVENYKDNFRVLMIQMCWQKRFQSCFLAKY